MLFWGLAICWTPASCETLRGQRWQPPRWSSRRKRVGRDKKKRWQRQGERKRRAVGGETRRSLGKAWQNHQGLRETEKEEWKARRGALASKRGKETCKRDQEEWEKGWAQWWQTLILDHSQVCESKTHPKESKQLRHLSNKGPLDSPKGTPTGRK